MPRSFRFLTVYGIPVEINPSWFVIFALVVWTLARGYFPINSPELASGQHWLMAIIASLFLFASLLLHELAHSIVAKRNNLPIKKITLFIFGGVAQITKEPQNAWIELKMASAGPIMSYILALFFWLLTKGLLILGTPHYLLTIFTYLCYINAAVATFNLIPGFPLDGGRIMRAIIWHFTSDLRLATLVSTSLGKGVAYLLILLGLFYLFTGFFISGIWFIFIGIFLLEAAQSSYQQVVMKKTLMGVKVSEVMSTNVISVPPDITIEHFIDHYILKTRHISFPVMEDGKLLGLLTLHDIKHVPKESWPMTTVRAVMQHLKRGMLIKHDHDCMEALALMARGETGRLLVVDDSHLVGIIAQKDIIRLFELKADIGE